MTDPNTISTYVAAVRGDLAGVNARDRDEALAELEALLADAATRMGEAEAVGALGDPHRYADSVRSALTTNDGVSEEGSAQPQGRVLGMPYDFRGLSADRIASRLWNPADPHIFTPRLFGVGWTINFGALAVKAGLLRPDDAEAEVFEHAPASVVRMVLAVPMVLAAATAGLIIASWRLLPAEVPMHWGFSGAPDDWAPKIVAFGLLALLAVVPVVITGARVLRRGVSARSRVLSSAVLTLLSTIGLGVTVLTVADADGGASGNYSWVVIVAGFTLSFLLLYVPARLGLRADWRESLGQDRERN